MINRILLYTITVIGVGSRVGGWGQAEGRAGHEMAYIFIESWKTGQAQIEELKIELNLSCEEGDTSVERILRNRSGEDKYRLIAKPAYPCSGGATPGWIVFLYGLGDEVPERNLLRPTADPAQDYFTMIDFPFIFSLAPGEIPLRLKRVVKIEGFYCILSVLLAVPKPPPDMMSSIRISLELTNTFP